MKKIVKLTESDLTRLVKKVIKEDFITENSDLKTIICGACGAEDSIHWDKREIGIDDKHGSYLDLTFRYCDECGNVTDVDLS